MSVRVPPDFSESHLTVMVVVSSLTNNRTSSLIYTHILKRGPSGVRRPIDGL